MPKTQVTIPIFIPHGGCPNRCLFCNQQRSGGDSSIPDPGSIRAKVDSYLATIGPGVGRIEIAFFGANFTGLPAADQESLLRTAFAFVGSGAAHGIRLSTRPDYIDDERIGLLRRYRVGTVELGIQSFSDDVLRAAGRGHTSADSLCAVELLHGAGIHTVLQIMAGLPGDTREGAIETARIAASLRPSGIRVFPTVVLKDTGLEALYRAGDYLPMELDEAVDACRGICRVFEEHGIPVIRTGLHPLRGGGEDVVAGPYHPAFGFLVKSRAKRELMAGAIEEYLAARAPHPPSLTLDIPSFEAEEYIGLRRENIVWLENRFSPLAVTCRILPDTRELAIRSP